MQTASGPRLEAFIKAINTAVVALSTFEPGLVVHREYRNDESHVIVVRRRTPPRFVSAALLLAALGIFLRLSEGVDDSRIGAAEPGLAASSRSMPPAIPDQNGVSLLIQ